MLKIKNIIKLEGLDFLGFQRDYDCKIRTVNMSIDLKNNDMPLYYFTFDTKNNVYGRELIIELNRKKSVEGTYKGTYEMRNNITKGKWMWYSEDLVNMNIFKYKLGLYIENISKDIFLQQIPF